MAVFRAGRKLSNETKVSSENVVFGQKYCLKHLVFDEPTLPFS